MKDKYIVIYSFVQDFILKIYFLIFILHYKNYYKHLHSPLILLIKDLQKLNNFLLNSKILKNLLNLIFHYTNQKLSIPDFNYFY